MDDLVAKCNEKEWCSALNSVMTEANRKGINPVVVTSFSTGKSRLVAVAYKKTERDTGICLNYCPFCGQCISPGTVSQWPQEDNE